QPAPESSPAELAARHLELGNLLLFGKHYAEAIAEYRAGYALDPRPIFLYNIGQAQRLAGDCKAAAEAYRGIPPTNPPPERAHLAEHNIRLCPAALSARPPALPARPPALPARPPALPAPAPPAASTPPALVAQDRTPWYRDAVGDVLAIGGATLLLTGGIL